MVHKILGGSLPKMESADEYYYYLTMLTLFKLWRESIDLKGDSNTWKEIFDNHIFEERHRQIMKYMNLKHKCINSLDDFNSQRKKVFNSTFSYEGDALPDSMYADNIEDISNNIERDVEYEEIPSHKMVYRWDGMNRTELWLYEAGWTDK